MTSEHAGPDPTSPDEPAGSRRVVVLVAGLVALLLVAALVAWLALRGTDPSGASDDTGDEPGAEQSQDAGTPDPSGTASGTATPEASGTPSTSAAPSPTPTAAATTLPADLALPAEGQEGWAATGWSYAPCGTQLSAAGAAGFRRVATQGAESSGHQSLLTFPTADAAAAFLASMRAAAEACAGPGDAGADVPAVAVGTLDGDWDESLSVVQSYPDLATGYGPGGDYTLAVRTGTAVAVSGGFAEWPPGYPTPHPPAVAEYRAALDALAPELCVFTDDGC